MFYYISGTLVLVNSNMCVVDTGGIGYKLTVSMMTAEKLSGNEGKNVKLYTFLAVREDGVELFGFESNEEKHAFNMLTSVSGIGPKAAMNILSIMSAETLAMAVCTEDTKAIAKAQNIGAKTAARIVLELKDKIAKDINIITPKATSATAESQLKITGNLSEANEALLVLGYDKSTVSKVLQTLDPRQDVGTLIREALKKLSR